MQSPGEILEKAYKQKGFTHRTLADALTVELENRGLLQDGKKSVPHIRIQRYINGQVIPPVHAEILANILLTSPTEKRSFLRLCQDWQSNHGKTKNFENERRKALTAISKKYVCDIRISAKPSVSVPAKISNSKESIAQMLAQRKSLKWKAQNPSVEVHQKNGRALGIYQFRHGSSTDERRWQN